MVFSVDSCNCGPFSLLCFIFLIFAHFSRYFDLQCLPIVFCSVENDFYDLVFSRFNSTSRRQEDHWKLSPGKGILHDNSWTCDQTAICSPGLPFNGLHPHNPCNYKDYWLQRDGRLGWNGWLTHSGQFTNEVVTFNQESGIDWVKSTSQRTTS